MLERTSKAYGQRNQLPILLDYVRNVRRTGNASARAAPTVLRGLELSSPWKFQGDFHPENLPPNHKVSSAIRALRRI